MRPNLSQRSNGSSNSANSQFSTNTGPCTANTSPTSAYSLYDTSSFDSQFSYAPQGVYHQGFSQPAVVPTTSVPSPTSSDKKTKYVCTQSAFSTPGLPRNTPKKIISFPPSSPWLYVPSTSLPHSSALISAPSLTSPETSSSKKDTPYTCLHPGCGGRFARSYDLDRHVKTHFPNTVHRHPCPRANLCGREGERGFSRKDHLNDHLRKVHMQHIPKSARGMRR